MQNMMVKLADVKEQINEKIKHPYLLKHIETPIIDEDKLLLLLSLLNKGTIPELIAKKYCITIMLIQIALDTHELVSNHKLDSEELKSRQLTVLAGVYYSGLYYKILAGIDDIEMIRSLAEGIKEVNEHKISLYQKSANTLDGLMNDVKMIESSLFVKVASYLDVTEWSDFSSNLLFIKRLNAEREMFLQGRKSIVFEAIRNIIAENEKYHVSKEQDKDLLAICDHYIDFSKKLIQKHTMKFPIMDDELLGRKIQAILGKNESYANTFVEEG
ncbi:heptaprenyl diphosphate synthase component 1 [Cytobacillus massiliigabonensis]|uniref:heptaprenyl diphosphate synthase component 1 n=1 Tax=Cytobacillus massiliigabonensis TaxID=1871011 RepID=UPI000C81D85B|nr:heptaprenyl diphosphate synthase component 1 [Cytobacillus massiliigabonensis]